MLVGKSEMHFLTFNYRLSFRRVDFALAVIGTTRDSSRNAMNKFWLQITAPTANPHIPPVRHSTTSPAVPTSTHQ